MTMHADAEVALRDAADGVCPLCHVGFVIHHARACCPCCGDTYLAADERLEIRKCATHGRDCEHWQAVWRHRR